ncbi:stalk domain-containing protein [Cohnella ginsengisoli]|uniref:Stalk domain-containing protein n=1 Tax=Cohnella ginsengisoli TaxID=425004 RepID=A0A9X4KNP9_9BACL|nr:CAP domain-containing protein [Cohnella ginsengisoli]MDG0794784.1 stalk domain-containing protein [Cohnella ginsengisoli]
MRRYGTTSKAGLALLLAVGLAAPAPGGAGSVSAAGAAANAIVDGKPVVFAEAVPVIQAGRMLVPARALLEAMGARMAWDPDARIVTATMQEAKGGGTVLKLKIGSPYVQRTLTDASGKTSDYVVKLDVAAQLLSDSTMIPLRASAELTGHALEWRQASKTAVISQPDAGAAQEMTFKQYALSGELFRLSNEEIEVFFRTNDLRARHGKTKPFALNAKLSLVAWLKSADMGEQGYFDHESPTYGDPFEMMRDEGIQFRAGAENIAAGHETPQAVVAGWERSPGHLANMLGDYAQIGIGYAYYTDSDYHSYWTQQFIGP